MSIHTTHPPYESPLALPNVPPPWMPLEGLIQFWATFASGASEMPQATDALEAASQAFAALATEQTAFGDYAQTCLLRKRHQPPHVGANDEDRLVEDTLNRQDGAIKGLKQAATHWRKVALALDHSASYVYQQDAALRHDLQVLIVHACSQRLRVWTIAQHLLQEDLISYQNHSGIATNLFDDGEEQVQKGGSQ